MPLFENDTVAVSKEGCGCKLTLTMVVREKPGQHGCAKGEHGTRMPKMTALRPFVTHSWLLVSF
jgi:hypothetical protein